MAEGGIAAAMANVDTADDWRTHFRDTMRGGKLLNNWRMAELHAQEAPDRVRELEQWGALFDRTEDGRILQRAFGGHTFKRLCHVGDRTGLEMIRTLQDRGVHLGVDVYMECAVTRLSEGRRPDRRSLRLLARAGALRRLQGEVGRPRDGRHRKGLAHHVQLLGIHRRRHGARLRRGRRAAGHGVRAVPSDRHGLAAGRAGNPW